MKNIARRIINTLFPARKNYTATIAYSGLIYRINIDHLPDTTPCAIIMRSKEGNTMSKHYEQRKEANARWAAKKERFYMYLDPEDKEDFAAYAKAKGESLTAFLIRCAKAEMERNPIKTPQEHL